MSCAISTYPSPIQWHICLRKHSNVRNCVQAHLRPRPKRRQQEPLLSLIPDQIVHPATQTVAVWRVGGVPHQRPPQPPNHVQHTTGSHKRVLQATCLAGSQGLHSSLWPDSWLQSCGVSSQSSMGMLLRPQLMNQCALQRIRCRAPERERFQETPAKTNSRQRPRSRWRTHSCMRPLNEALFMLHSRHCRGG